MNRTSKGNKIKELRKKAGLNQAIIAEYLQLDQSLFSKIEKGQIDASTHILKKLADLFGCQVSAIHNEEEDVSCINVSFLNNGMTKDDLNSIAVINRIASNLENMQKLLDDKACR